MPLTAWSAGLDTGDPDIDEQHRDLFQLHAGALASARAGDAAATRSALQRLLEETRRHFAFEEEMMASSGYGPREAHAGDHAAFLRDLGALVSEAGREASSPLVRLWLESRCDAWWKYHVRSADAALVAHFASAVTAPRSSAK